MELLFSVCICTRNRAELLYQALTGLAQQSLAGAHFEVLVVDNASSDDTAQVANSFAAQLENLRLIREEIVGLSAARNRGAAEASGEWVAYLDDDGLPPPDWLEQARAIILSATPDLLGGPFFPFYTTPKPAWFKDQYGTGAYGERARWMNDDEYLFGGNLFIRRKMLLEVGGFPVSLGPHGEQLFYGDETGLIRLLRKENPDLSVYYDPQIAIRHWVAPFKMTLFGRARQRWAEGRSGYLAFRQPGDNLHLIHLLGLIAMPVILLWRFTVGLLLRNRKRFPAWQNYVYEAALNDVAIWGKLYQRLRSSWDRGTV